MKEIIMEKEIYILSYHVCVNDSIGMIMQIRNIQL